MYLYISVLNVLLGNGIDLVLFRWKCICLVRLVCVMVVWVCFMLILLMLILLIVIL